MLAWLYCWGQSQVRCHIPHGWRYFDRQVLPWKALCSSVLAHVACILSSVQGRHVALQVSYNKQTGPKTDIALKTYALVVCSPVSIPIALHEQRHRTASCLMVFSTTRLENTETSGHLWYPLVIFNRMQTSWQHSSLALPANFSCWIYYGPYFPWLSVQGVAAVAVPQLQPSFVITDNLSLCQHAREGGACIVPTALDGSKQYFILPFTWYKYYILDSSAFLHTIVELFSPSYYYLDCCLFLLCRLTQDLLCLL